MDQNNKKSLALSEIQKILSLAEDKNFKAGEVIFEEGNTDNNFYIVLRGSIEISKKTTDGQPKVIAQVSAGEFLGEGVLSGSNIKPATATVIEDVTLLTLSYESFEKLTQESPKDAIDFLITVLKAVSGRLSKTNVKLLALFEISQLLNQTRGDLNALAQGLIKKLLNILNAKEGILIMKNPFANTYRVIHSSSEGLNEESLKGIDLEKSQKMSDDNGHLLIANLKDMGALVIRRDRDYTSFESDQLRLLILIAEQAANTIKEATQNAAEKAKKLLHRKRFEI